MNLNDSNLSTPTMQRHFDPLDPAWSNQSSSNQLGDTILNRGGDSSTNSQPYYHHGSMQQLVSNANGTNQSLAQPRLHSQTMSNQNFPGNTYQPTIDGRNAFSTLPNPNHSFHNPTHFGDASYLNNQRYSPNPISEHLPKSSNVPLFSTANESVNQVASPVSELVRQNVKYVDSYNNHFLSPNNEKYPEFSDIPQLNNRDGPGSNMHQNHQLPSDIQINNSDRTTPNSIPGVNSANIGTHFNNINGVNFHVDAVASNNFKNSIPFNNNQNTTHSQLNSSNQSNQPVPITQRNPMSNMPMNHMPLQHQMNHPSSMPSSQLTQAQQSTSPVHPQQFPHLQLQNQMPQQVANLVRYPNYSIPNIAPYNLSLGIPPQNMNMGLNFANGIPIHSLNRNGMSLPQGVGGQYNANTALAKHPFHHGPNQGDDKSSRKKRKTLEQQVKQKSYIRCIDGTTIEIPDLSEDSENEFSPKADLPPILYIKRIDGKYHILSNLSLLNNQEVEQIEEPPQAKPKGKPGRKPKRGFRGIRRPDLHAMRAAQNQVDSFVKTESERESKTDSERDSERDTEKDLDLQ